MYRKKLVKYWLFKIAVAMAISLFAIHDIAAADTIYVQSDRSAEFLESHFEIGVTHVQTNWQYGNTTAVNRVKFYLKNAPISLQNVHLMGWGPGNPNPSPGVYDWGSLDSRIDMMRSMNAEMILTFCTAPGWMKISGEDWEMNDRVADEYMDEYAALCAKAALRYPDINKFQVWNEFKGFWSKTLNNWDVAKYTEFYNTVYAAVREARPDALIGGFYKGFSDEMTQGGVLTSYDLQMIDHWLDNMLGADFIAFDGSIHGWPHEAVSEDSLMKLSSCFGNVAATIRQKTELPIWVSEYYAANMVGNAQFQAANHASAYYHSLINGTAVALHWDPTNYAQLVTSTSTLTGGQPTSHYHVVRYFNRNFGPGRMLYKTTCSDSMNLDVLASATKTMLINKQPQPVNIVLDEDTLLLEAYEVKLQERELSTRLLRGEEKSLADVILPAGIFDSIVSFSSDNSDVVSIDDSGLMRAHSIGNAEILVSIEEAGFTDNLTINVNVEAEVEVTIRVDISGIEKPDWFNTMYMADSKITDWNFVPMIMEPENENVFYFTDIVLEGTTIRPTFAFASSWSTTENPPTCSQAGGGTRSQVIAATNYDFTFSWDEFGCTDELDPDILNPDPIAKILFSPSSVNGTVSRELMGQQLIYDKEADTLWNSPEALLLKEMKALSPGIFRYPGGVVTNYYHWNDPTGTYKDDNWNPAYNDAKDRDPSLWMGIDEYFTLCTEMQTTPLLGVNIESGLVYNREQDGIDEAVALVAYAKANGFTAAYYYLGNEPYVLDQNGVDFSASDYAHRFATYAEAIRAEDPEAKLIAAWHRYIAEDTEDLHAVFEIAGEYIDVVDFHWYWNTSQSSMALWRNQQGMKASVLNYTGGTYEEDAKAFKDSVASWGYPDVKLASLEYNVGAGNTYTGPSEYDLSLMIGEMLLQFMNGSVDMACLWPMHYPFQYYADHSNKRTLFASNRNLEKNAMYDIFDFLKFVKGKRLLSSYSDNDWIYTVALLDSVSGDVDLYLLNRAETSISARLPLSDSVLTAEYMDQCTVSHYVDGENYRADTLVGAVSIVDGKLAVELPAFSVTKVSLPEITSVYRKENYELSIVIGDAEEGKLLPGCEVDLDGRKVVSDAQGEVHIDSLDYGEYNLTISAERYMPMQVKRFELVSDSSLSFSLSEAYDPLSVLVRVVDRSSKEPVYRAMVRYNGLLSATNTAGEVVLGDLGYGELLFTVEHGDYFTSTDTIEIGGDTSIVIQLEKTLADIQFSISDTLGPLSHVQVRLNAYTVATDALGLVFFSSQPAREEYSYSIEKTGYKSVSDTFLLEIDTLLNIVLEIETAIEAVPFADLEIYPNPVSEMLYIRFLQGEAKMELISIDGGLLMQRKLKPGNESIDVSDLPSGCYFLRISSGKGNSFFKLIITH